MELKFAPLYSGSSGNAIYVGDGETNLLIDAGVSGIRVERALKRIGIDPKSISAVFTTHEHADHIAGIGVLQRKYGMPIYATAGTWDGIRSKCGSVDPSSWVRLIPGEDFYMGGMNIMPFATPHDANEPCGFTFEVNGAKFALATDVGSPKHGWTEYIMGSDAVLLESNYDYDMLMAGSYPYSLKTRIAGRHGHLQNEDAGNLAVRLYESGARHIVLGHLSKENNTPEHALQCTQYMLKKSGIDPEFDLRVDVALRDDVTGLFAVTAGFE